MNSERVYFYLVLAILLLLFASGILAFIFFYMLPSAEPPPAPLPPAALPVARPEPGVEPKVEPPPPAVPLEPVALKFDVKRPATAPPAAPAGKGEPEKPRGPEVPGFADQAWTELLEDVCDDYGGDFDPDAKGADFDLLPGVGEICLEMRRPEIYIPENEKLRYTHADREGRKEEVDACALDPDVRVCMRLLDADIDVLPAGPGRAGGKRRVSAEPCDDLGRWHSFVQGKDFDRDGGADRGIPSDAVETDLSHRVNVFTGDDPAEWFPDLPTPPTLQYRDIYPGIDMAWYSRGNLFEYVFTLWPEADVSRIRFTFDGASDVAVDELGNLVIYLECGKIVQRAPLIYRLTPDGESLPLRGTYFLDESGAVRYRLDRTVDADEKSPAPALHYLSYLGREHADRAFANAVDAAGCVYVAGETAAPTNAGAAGGKDAFVTKYRPRDGRPLFTTYFGGSGDDRALDVAVDHEGNVYVCGETLSGDFPATNMVGGARVAGSRDAFLVQLDGMTGEIAFAARLGGTGDDRAYGLAVDRENNVYIAGETASPNFPDVPGYRAPGLVEGRKAFLVKLSAAEKSVVYTALLGGASQAAAYAVAVDREGCAYLTGETSSADFPVRRPLQPRHKGGPWDAFVVKLTPAGDNLAYATFLGGTGDDRGYGIDVDSAGNCYVAGETASSDFPVHQAFQSAHGGGDWDAFAVKLKPDGDLPAYATYIGGSGSDRGMGIAADTWGNAYLAGATGSTNFPLKQAVQTGFGGGGWDGFICRLHPGAGAPAYATFIGGSGNDQLFSVCVDPARNVHAAGCTDSIGLQVRDATQTSYGGGASDTMLAAIRAPIGPGPEMRLVAGGGQPDGPRYDYYMSAYEILNAEFVEFLNDAQANPGNGRGTNMFFDARGNVWISPEMVEQRDEMFSVYDSRIVYDPELPTGNRYGVSPAIPLNSGSYTNHPVSGVSWYGAVKYCNWLTIDTARGDAERCYREGTNTFDWAPVSCSVSNWVRGVFTALERTEWLKLEGYRLPMDNCAGFAGWDPNLFKITNSELARFLNNAQVNLHNDRGAHLYFDAGGNAWFNPSMQSGRDEIFTLQGSGLRYDKRAPRGNRFLPRSGERADGTAWSNAPAANVSCFGALKYCNWLTIDDGKGLGDRSYREGTNTLDWAPVTCSEDNWREGNFIERDRLEWEELKGHRLPYTEASLTNRFLAASAAAATNSSANDFNEFYKAAAWNGTTNTKYGFGRNDLGPKDANYLDSGLFPEHDTSPAGFYDGTDHGGDFLTASNHNYYGIFDLSGNVSEWLTDPGITGSLTDRACYGGSWLFAMPEIRRRFYVHPFFTDRFRGFRVVTTKTAADMHAIRIPYHICLCGYGTGPGCGPPEIAEEEVEVEVPEEEKIGERFTVEDEKEEEKEEKIIYKKTTTTSITTAATTIKKPKTTKTTRSTTT